MRQIFISYEVSFPCVSRHSAKVMSSLLVRTYTHTEHGPKIF